MLSSLLILFTAATTPAFSIEEPIAETKDSVAATSAIIAPTVSEPTREEKRAKRKENLSKWKLHGSIQADVLTFPSEDSKINTGEYKDKFMTNTYAELHLMHRNFQAGARLEYLDHPLPGFEDDFKGWGVPYFYIKGMTDWGELTFGDYYEQFGSGLILRAYEQRSLGIDNSLRGARLALKPYKGINFKLLAGQQRVYWSERNLTNSSPWTVGADLELGLDQWIKPLEKSGTHLTLGLSAVGNYAGEEEDILTLRPTGELDPNTGEPAYDVYRLNMPRKVGAFDVRAQLQKGNYSFLAEYAWKGQDPSSVNGYLYGKRRAPGSALLLSGSYSKRGMSVLLQAKRSEDMAYRSRRTYNQESTAGYLNHLPAFTYQHTYALAALYPYATQMVPGEWAFQGEVAYNFKRRTPLGGKYGTLVKVNYSHIRSIEQQGSEEPAVGENIKKSRFFKMGNETYYQDLNIQIEKKLAKRFKLNVLYAYQQYNQFVIEGHGSEAVKSHILVAEGKFNINKRLTLRGEAQYLHTKQDQKDWWYGLLELSVLPNLMFTVSDQFNAHVVDETTGEENRVHYLMGSVTFTHRAHRLQLSYGKTRAGYNCSGGVCRFIPATKGLQASYTFNF